MENFDISSTLKKKPKLKKQFWNEIKNNILGENYELSLVFIGNKKSKSLNNKFRNKNHSANVLSFHIDKNFGEIFINFPNAHKESKNWFLNIPDKNRENSNSITTEFPLKNRSTENFIDFLFIHGLSHLKGHDHIEDKDAVKMERFEKKIRKKFFV